MEFKTQYGNRNSPKGDFFASDVWGKLGVAVEGGAFNTEGFPIVTASERGIIDNNAEVDFRNLNVRADYRANDRLSVFFRGGYFKEDRVNGKINEVNDTKWTAVGGGVRVRMPDDSDFQATVFTDDNTFHSTFLAVTAPSATVPARSIVRLATDQTVPANAVGTMVQWSRPIGRKNFFSTGFDWRQVDGDSLEDAYIATPGAPIVPPTAPATLSLRRNSGGTQDSVGFFLQNVFSMNNLVATLSARVDSWKNHDGHIFENSVSTGLPSAGNRGELPDREDTVVSPRGALLYRISDRVSVWGDVGWGFRAPTLNELYRQFSVGLVRTLANENLGPERLFGGEAGVRLEAARNLSVRSTLYDNTVKDPVSTSPSPPTSSSGRTSGARAFAAGRTTWRCASALRFASPPGISSTTRRSRRTRPTLPWWVCTSRRCRNTVARSVSRTLIRASPGSPRPACSSAASTTTT